MDAIGSVPGLVDINPQHLALLEGCLFCLLLIGKSSHLMLPTIAWRTETPISHIAEYLGIPDAVIRPMLAKSDVEGGPKPGTAELESAELREAKKRIRLLELQY